eukprot:3039149-Karenia_brevis.AAC.1
MAAGVEQGQSSHQPSAMTYLPSEWRCKGMTVHLEGDGKQNNSKELSFACDNFELQIAKYYSNVQAAARAMISADIRKIRGHCKIRRLPVQRSREEMVVA